MIETIKDFITAYLPTASSIAAVIVAVTTFLKRVKELVSNTAKENKDLKNLLETFAEANNQLQTRTASFDENVNETIRLLKEELSKSQIELQEVKQIKEEYEKLVDEVNTVKAQNNRLIKELEEK